jgi:hypothetical protein
VGRIDMPNVIFHVTTLKALPNIFEEGLKCYLPKIAKQDGWTDLRKGVYLTSDWEELVTSLTVPELTTNNQLVVIEINASTLVLEPDPEYPHDNDDLFAAICRIPILPELFIQHFVIEKTTQRGTSVVWNKL